MPAVDNFWEHLDEIEPGAVAKLATIATERRWEVIFLVRRIPIRGSTSQLQSQRWLIARGFEIPSVYVIRRPLAALVQALDLDVVVDSPFEYVLERAAHSRMESDGSGGSPQAEPTPVPRSEIKALGSIDECLRRICEIDSGPRQRFNKFARRLLTVARSVK